MSYTRFFYGEILSHLTVNSFIPQQVKKMTKMMLSVFVAVVYYNSKVYLMD